MVKPSGFCKSCCEREARGLTVAGVSFTQGLLKLREMLRPSWTLSLLVSLKFMIHLFCYSGNFYCE